MEPPPSSPTSTPDMVLPEETMEALLHRVAERRRSGGQAPRVELPPNKEAFHKLLSLDLNQWVYLGHARYGFPDGDRYRGALEAIDVARKRGSIVVPVADMNAFEAAQRVDPDSRRRTS